MNEEKFENELKCCLGHKYEMDERIKNRAINLAKEKQKEKEYRLVVVTQVLMFVLLILTMIMGVIILHNTLIIVLIINYILLNIIIVGLIIVKNRKIDLAVC